MVDVEKSKQTWIVRPCIAYHYISVFSRMVIDTKLRVIRIASSVSYLKALVLSPTRYPRGASYCDRIERELYLISLFPSTRRCGSSQTHHYTTSVANQLQRQVQTAEQTGRRLKDQVLRLPRFLHRREWHNLTRLTKRKRATRKINDENNMAEHHRLINHTIEGDSAQCLTYSTNHFRLLTLKSWLQKSTITDAIEATYTFFLFGNRTKRSKITDGWKVTNHDRPTPQESYGQQHHG